MMRDQPASSTNRERFWITVWFSALVLGIDFIFQAVPLLFGDNERSWLGTFFGILITVPIVAIIVWISGPLTIIRSSKWPTDVARRPAVSALKGGVVSVVVVFILGLLLYTSLLPADIRLSAAITLALAQGAWSTFMVYLAYKFMRKVSRSAQGM